MKMPIKLSLLPLLAIILISQANVGKSSNFTDESIKDRNKRQTKPANLQFWTGIEGKAGGPHFNYNVKFSPDHISKGNIELPFWANRGRRNSISEEHFVGQEYPTPELASVSDKDSKQMKQYLVNSYKSYSSNSKHPFIEKAVGNMHLAEDRKKRSISENKDVKDLPYILWGSKSRGQEDDPFWATRGRRQDDPPFWGARGRRMNLRYSDINDKNDEREPFWGNRGRREKLAESRAKLRDIFYGWGSRGRAEPFWSKIDKNQITEQLWDSRGRRDDHDRDDPFWGSRGRRDDSDAIFRNTLANKVHLKDAIQDAIDKVEQNIEILSKEKLDIDSERKQVINQQGKLNGKAIKSTVASTFFNNDIYDEQPRFVFMDDEERNPLFGSRGKKKMMSYNMVPSSRDRRGSIEEIVKSVRNDPYFIARGKKEVLKINIQNSPAMHNKLNYAKDLICSTVNLILEKNVDNKTKRDIDDNERDTRSMLKKLAAQLQIDPYFVSRGKKSVDSENVAKLEEFINAIYNRCE